MLLFRHLQVTQATNQIVMNCADIDIITASFVPPGGEGKSLLRNQSKCQRFCFFLKAPVCKMLWRPTVGMQTTFTPLLTFIVPPDLTPVVCQLCELHKLKPLLVLIEMFIFRAPKASYTCVY